MSNLKLKATNIGICVHMISLHYPNVEKRGKLKTEGVFHYYNVKKRGELKT